VAMLKRHSNDENVPRECSFFARSRAVRVMFVIVSSFKTRATSSTWIENELSLQMCAEEARLVHNNGLSRSSTIASSKQVRLVCHEQ
jgi:hypothetical protein